MGSGGNPISGTFRPVSTPERQILPHRILGVDISLRGTHDAASLAGSRVPGGRVRLSLLLSEELGVPGGLLEGTKG